MCSLLSFGELNIPSSRAFWDDCDEDEAGAQDTVESLKLEYISELINSPIASNCFVIIEGLQVSEFVDKTLLQDATKIAKIPTHTSGSAIYTIKNKNLLLAVIEEDLTNSGEITELLVPYAKLAKNIITLTVKSKVEFKSEDIAKVREKITFIRGINSKLKTVQELEAPNFIAGIAAGVASFRSNNGLGVNSYVAYTDKLPLDTMAAEPILKLFKSLDVECASSYIPKTRDLSNLYM